MDVSPAPCARYVGFETNGQRPIDTACEAFFKTNARVTVAECRTSVVAPAETP